MSDSNNIANFDSDSLNPDLNRSGNKNPFRTEADYFENFADKMMQSIEEQEELSINAPLLSNIPKYNPFAAPAEYFEDLPSLIQERTLKTVNHSFSEWLRMIFRPNFALPVLCVILIAFGAIRYLEDSPQQKMVLAEEVTEEEQLQAIDESTIIEALASASENESEGDPENEIIKQYLIDNDVDDANLNYEL
ncbi:MAG: hypothetical protein K0Q95_3002 [Bacteroidota bacterium]|jgi:hypothetical protein|nr:hypothetical protein [Bacteroidota bacterium]